MTRLQLNFSSPSLLNNRILKLLVMNGNGLEKKSQYFRRKTLTFHCQQGNNLLIPVYLLVENMIEILA